MSLDNLLVNVDLIDATHGRQRGGSKLPRKEMLFSFLGNSFSRVKIGLNNIIIPKVG